MDLESTYRGSSHYRHRKIEQFASVKYVGRRVSDQSALMFGKSEKTIYYPGEETLRPVLMSAFAGGVELLHRPPDPAAILHYGNFVTRGALVGKVGDMLDIVEKGIRSGRVEID